MLNRINKVVIWLKKLLAVTLKLLLPIAFSAYFFLLYDNPPKIKLTSSL